MRDYLKLCKDVKNDRDIASVFEHLQSEVVELRDEIGEKITGGESGVDGISGESVDIILCALDAISLEYPDMTWQELDEIMFAKFSKWKRIYGDINE